MKVSPKTAEQVKDAGLISRGPYDFFVRQAEEAQSREGNEMIKLWVRVEDQDGRERTVIDYLVSTDGMAYKIRHFAESVGLLADYEAGNMSADRCEGRVGRCKIGIEAAKGDFPAKNKVTDYLVATSTMSVTPPKQSVADMPDDDIPF